MTPPAFSICIPNYNYANYIGETIQSVLNQTYPHYEIVVVDNASTDNSVEVIKSFGSDKIRLFENQYNVGFAPNLDRAAAQARNPYINVLSSDDLMRPTALEEYARVIESLGDISNDSLIVSSVDIIDSTGRIIDRTERADLYSPKPIEQNKGQFSDPEIEMFSGFSVLREIYPRLMVPGHFCSTCYSRSLYESVGGYSSINHIGPDAHFAYKALLRNANVVFVNKPLFAYRIHQSNQLAQGRKQSNLKVPIDRYLFTLQYSDAELTTAGANRAELVDSIIDDSCLKDGLNELRAGARGQAGRLLMVGFAFYPRSMFRNWKTYLLGLLLLCGPAGPYFARRLYDVYRKSGVDRQGEEQ